MQPTSTPTKFTDQLWSEIAPLYKSILDHPFNTELAQGTLSPERFKHYIIQDALYLEDFGRALALAGVRSTSPDRFLQFLKFAQDCVVVERALHVEYFRSFDLDPTDAKVARAPSCSHYTNYLLATASLRSYEETIASLLPCFWIYREVGSFIFNNFSNHETRETHPYGAWINTYSSEEFSASVEKAIEITNAVAESTTNEKRDLMRKAFLTSSRLEWMFWNGAYMLEKWPGDM